MRKVGMIFLAASIPLVAGGAAGTEKANQGGPSIERRNFSETEIQSTLKALGIAPDSASKSIGCAIENFEGIVTTTVMAASQPVGPLYWLLYQPGTTVTQQVRFVVTPLFTGSPLGTQVQIFNPNSASDVLTPFGIPSWGKGLTSGPWLLAVQNDSGQSASCNFTVQ